LAEVPEAGPVVLQCQGGGRSHIAASLLQNRGREVANLSGGYRAWEREGLPVER
jgi:hydroxyacylglutathione hydrolase